MSQVVSAELCAHPVARSQARATRDIPAGSVIMSVSAFAFVLLEAEKGRRCDACLRQAHTRGLKKCTGCAAYYYCDADCQRMHWDMDHRRICRVYNRMNALAGSYQLNHHERMDTLLLSHFLARIAPTAFKDSSLTGDDPLSVFLSLLRGPETPQRVLDVIPKALNSEEKLTQDIYSRFHNNNFTIHSHMNTIAHGVFPLASRYLNHSCEPNAAPKYILKPALPVNMEVVALRDIKLGEEICVPYLDPALLQAKHQAFQYTYGFICECGSCLLLRKLGQSPGPLQSLGDVMAVRNGLREFVGIGSSLGPELPTPSLADIPITLLCALQEDFIEQLSEEFSKAAHEGDYTTAITSGHTLLALYLLIYPRNYPQIGLHLLELAKTRWNAWLGSGVAPNGAEIAGQVRTILCHSQKILVIYGREGDEYGPLDEIHKLQQLLDE